jgi:hypothetical protein
MTWEAKPGCREKLLEWARKGRELPGGKDVASRIYSTRHGNWHQVTMEIEFETQEDLDKHWASIDWSLPEVQAYDKELWELVTPGHTTELLYVE